MKYTRLAIMVLEGIIAYRKPKKSSNSKLRENKNSTRLKYFWNLHALWSNGSRGNHCIMNPKNNLFSSKIRDNKTLTLEILWKFTRPRSNGPRGNYTVNDINAHKKSINSYRISCKSFFYKNKPSLDRKLTKLKTC